MGDVLAYLQFHKWWTSEQGTTGADGGFAARAFYGEYEITVTHGGVTVVETVDFLSGGQDTFEIVLSDIAYIGSGVSHANERIAGELRGESEQVGAVRIVFIALIGAAVLIIAAGVVIMSRKAQGGA
jgi:hypothetical protein